MVEITRTKVDFDLAQGIVEGIYTHTHQSAALVIITNGHNGFYNYGMFPYIQEKLAEAGIASYSYNFSHGGVKNGDDYFTDLEAYEKNSMRLERLDLIGILHNLGESEIPKPERGLFLLSHSLGSVPTLFAARDVLGEGKRVDGVVFLAPIKTLQVFPDEMIQQWQKTGVYHLKNNRTGQMLPQGPEFLQEILESDTTWNIEGAIKDTPTRFLMVHGAEDEDVPVQHSEALARWAREVGLQVELQIIPGAGHTFNSSHPFQDTSCQLEDVLEIVTRWVLKHAT